MRNRILHPLFDDEFERAMADVARASSTVERRLDTIRAKPRETAPKTATPEKGGLHE